MCAIEIANNSSEFGSGHDDANIIFSVGNTRWIGINVHYFHTILSNQIQV